MQKDKEETFLQKVEKIKKNGPSCIHETQLANDLCFMGIKGFTTFAINFRKGKYSCTCSKIIK